MVNVLVTGANGQLGNEMRVVSGNSANRYVFTDVAELDITDRELVRTFVKREGINVVVNCAAYTNVDKAEEEEGRADLINHRAVENLALVCRENQAALIHVSTDYVFQGEGCIPCNEDMPTDPLGVYGVTKLRGEQAVLRSGCPAVILRTSWLYSEYGNNFVKTMRRLTAEREVLNVVESMRASLLSDVFIIGANAITMKGEIVSIDGEGNRVAGMMCGPKHVIIVVGRNKICLDLDQALKRIRNVAAPLNYIRHINKHHNRYNDLPCVQRGKCFDCTHPRSACRKIAVIRGEVEFNADRIHLLVVNNDLGL